MRMRYATLSTQRAIELPEDLDGCYQQGRLPWPVADALTFAEAVAVAQALPTVRRERDGLPVGYGLLPPVNAEPSVTLGKEVRDAYGVAIPAGTSGMVGAIWRRHHRVVVRLWFRGLDAPGHQGKQVRGPADVYNDAIATVRGLAGVVPQLTGWEIARLDHGAPETLSSTGDLVDAHGQRFSAADPSGGGGGGTWEELEAARRRHS